MNKYIKFVFEHKKDKDQIIETYSIQELLYGVGGTNQPVKELVEALKEDGYILIDTIV